MKFQKKKPRRKAYYGKAYREAQREQLYTEIGKALAKGNSQEEAQRIVDAYNVSVNPIMRSKP